MDEQTCASKLLLPLAALTVVDASVLMPVCFVSNFSINWHAEMFSTA